MPEIPHDWFTDESFWEAAFPFLFPEARFAHAITQVDNVLKLAGTEPESLLDLCCGPGRHSIEFARRGLDVTGVDRSPYLLSKAHKAATEEQLDIEWIEQDMRDFRRPESFDLAINLFTSFGYFEDDAENLAVLRNVYDSLKPGGTFVIDTLGKEPLARIFEPMRVQEVPGSGWMIQKAAIIDDWNRIFVEVLLVGEEGTSSHGFRHWLYSGREMKEMLRGAGFAEIQLMGNLGGSPYGSEADRLVAVARKS